MTTAIIGTGGIGSVVARQLGSGGEPLRLSSANTESARTLASRKEHPPSSHAQTPRALYALPRGDRP
jgi:predicted dinucleotide-binding enzyme